MIKVYHRKELYFPEKVEKSIKDSLIDMDLYELVAEVEGEDLDTAWQLTNTGEISWPKLQGVKNVSGKGVQDVRSTSVGDLLIDSQDQAHLVDWQGFKTVLLSNQ